MLAFSSIAAITLIFFFVRFFAKELVKVITLIEEKAIFQVGTQCKSRHFLSSGPIQRDMLVSVSYTSVMV